MSKREYYLKNKEKIFKARAEYRKRNKEKIKEEKKQYYLKNKEKILKARAEYVDKTKITIPSVCAVFILPQNLGYWNGVAFK